MAGMITISSKVTQETSDQFTAAFEASGCETKNQFYELILERYLNPKVKTVDVPRPTDEQLQELQLKDNEIGRIKTAYDLKSDEVVALGEELRLLTKALQEKQAPGLDEGQIILTIPPIIGKVLEVEAATAKRKSGKEFSFGDILLNNFWESIKNGVSHPFRIWSSSELAKVANDLKPAE
jgi:hypothetical protein